MGSDDAAWAAFRAAPVDPVTRRYWQISTDIVRDHVRRATAYGGRVLDVGCGHGARTLGFARCGLRCTGIDTSAAAVDAAKIAAREAGVAASFAVAAAEDLPFDDRHFDAVVLASVLQHVGNQRLALREARRVLRPDGALVCSVPQTLRASTRATAGLYTMHFTLQSLDVMLAENAFEVVRVEGSGLLLPVVRPVLLRLGRAIDPVRVFDELERIPARFPQVASSLTVTARPLP
jgi:ubiquinone/menaquinone biosynthesis C-methylase UbiE